MQYRGAKNEHVLAYRHTLVEFDYDRNGNPVPKEIQYAALINSGFPISAIVDSANKSLQATVRIDAADKAQYDQRVEIVYGHFRQYDFFDDDNKAENKYCRLPGCDRQLFDKDGNPTTIARQKLLAVKIGPVSWNEWQTAQTQQHSKQNRFKMSVQTSQELQSVIFKPCQLIMGDWLRAGDIGFVYGARGCGKTWFVDGIAVHASIGEDFDTWKIPGKTETYTSTEKCLEFQLKHVLAVSLPITRICTSCIMRFFSKNPAQS